MCWSPQPWKSGCRPGSRARAAAGSRPNTACCRAPRWNAPAVKPPPASRAAARSKSGAWVALADCIAWMKTRNMSKANVLRDNVAASSCGIYQGTPVLDLDYAEDSEADTDANFVMTGDGRIIEVQGTAEKTPFSHDEF